MGRGACYQVTPRMGLPSPAPDGAWLALSWACHMGSSFQTTKVHKCLTVCSGVCRGPPYCHSVLGLPKWHSSAALT